MIDPPLSLIRDRARWTRRLNQAKDAIKAARARELQPTPYFVEALAYWDRAYRLQEMNLGRLKRGPVGDALQEAVPIYDTVRRRYAGFSNVLEQLRYGAEAPKYQRNAERGIAYPRFEGSEADWLYLCLVHRVTGSGASFEHDHGWRNTIVPQLAAEPRRRWETLLFKHPGPCFTSIGNQIPPFSPKTTEARTAGQEYLAVIGPKLVQATLACLRHQPRPRGIKSAVDEVLRIQRHLGCKQFKFVLTAWVMDLAEYLPHLVDPNSDCYHGKNAQEALAVCFEPTALTKQDFYDRATRLFADLTGTWPMDVEDAAPGCDLIRWLENYVPRNGFQHVIDQGIFNSSSLVYSRGRQP